MDHTDLRLVTVYMRNDPYGARSHARGNIMHKDDVDTFIRAQLQLHYEPGINPHIKDRDPHTSIAWRIGVARLAKFKAYWWSVPGLQRNDDEANGAMVTDWEFDEEVWKHPDLIRKELVDEYQLFRRKHKLPELPTCEQCMGVTDGEAEIDAVCICAKRLPEPEDECPNCKNGTIGLEEGELRCRGECGTIFGK